MTGIPAWLLDIVAAVMLVVAAVSAARLVALCSRRRGAGLRGAGLRGPWRLGRTAAVADVDVAHLLMAIAMAGMLAPSLTTLPEGAWEVIFGVLTVWFAYQVARDARRAGVRALAAGHCAPHLVHASAMLYMFLALTAPAAHISSGMGDSGMGSGMGGMGGSGMQTLSLATLAFVFALILVGYSVWDLDRVSGPGAGGHYNLVMSRPVPAAVLAGVPAGSGEAPGDVRSEARPAVGGQAGDEADRAVSCAVPAGLATSSPVLAPWVATGCRIAMGVTMAFMLIIMI